jgi:hypothetical protein
MSSYTSISSEKLARLIGTVKAPTLIDVHIDEDFAADPRLIPGATRALGDARRPRGLLQHRRPASCSRRHLTRGTTNQS